MPGLSLSWAVLDAYKQLGRGLTHVPRTSIDRLVVRREIWNVPLGELPFVRTPDEPACFVAAHHWQRRVGVPRYVFVKLPSKVKPFYVDFASSTLVAALATEIRHALAERGPDEVATVTEILPAPAHAWLPDGIGRRYTSELRFQVVDPYVAECPP